MLFLSSRRKSVQLYHRTDKQKQFEVVPTEAEIVRKIFSLYNNDGWGYKKISNYLTEQGVPTPRMCEQMRKEAEGETSTRKFNAAWAIITVQGILDNDFYIGTLRQGKFTRAKINGKDVRRDEDEQIVIENHHQAIIDYRTFATTRALREKRSRSNYRGVKINDNVYSGFLVCGDCGSPMFAMSRRDLKPAYTCGTYHRRGISGCTSHHIRVDKLDELLKEYLQKLLSGSEAMLKQLNAELQNEDNQVVETEQSADHLAEVMADLQEELKVTKRQRIRDLMKHPDQEAILEETYDELEADLQKKIEGIQYQIQQLADRRNTILRVNRVAKTALDVFRDILQKDHLERNDLNLIIDKILVFEDHIEVKLQSDVDTLLRTGSLEEAANFNRGVENILKTRIVQSAAHQKDKVFDVNVISNGDPLEIYTEKDGSVIFRKYSPMGDLQEFAVQMCDAISDATGHIAAVSDRDSIIAVHGAPKRELLEKPNSPQLDALMKQRKNYLYRKGETRVPLSEATEKYHLGAASPILSQGDLMGCVMLLLEPGAPALEEPDQLLARAAAGFLGRQMEQ